MLYWKTIMKRLSILFVLAVMMTGEGFAQRNSGVEVIVSSGYLLPSSPMTFSNYWKMQYGGGIGAGIALSPSVTLLGAVEYYRFTLNATGVGDSYDTKYMRDIWAFTDVSLTPAADPSSVLSVSANLRVSPAGTSGVLSPYVTAGAGVMRVSLGKISLPTRSVVSVDGSDIAMTAQQSITGGNETSPLVQVGVGLDVHVTAVMIFFVEARYAHGFSKGLGTSYVPLTAGMKISL
jgi:opacity protein-like surface antigen